MLLELSPGAVQTGAGLIFLENATDIEFSSCRILAAADTGTWPNHATAKINITGNWIEDTGYCGIFAYGFWRRRSGITCERPEHDRDGHARAQ